MSSSSSSGSARSMRVNGTCAARAGSCVAVALDISGGRGGAGCAVQAAQLLLQRFAATVVQAVDRALGAAHVRGDLGCREADDVAHHDDVALLLGQGVERGAQVASGVEGAVVFVAVGPVDLFGGDRAAAAQVV